MSKRIDLTGRRFGRLTVLAYVGNDERSNARWLCRCDCGKQTIVRTHNLNGGTISSCGCLQREAARTLARKRNTTHGLYNHPMHTSWVDMKQRCNNKNNPYYEKYGGRGIRVCEEWENSFETFYNDMVDSYAPGLSIDRINNDGDYEPGNCRWADSITQANNKNSNRYITYDGIAHTLAEWSRLFGVSYSALRYRINVNNMTDFEKYFEKELEA